MIGDALDLVLVDVLGFVLINALGVVLVDKLIVCNPSCYKLKNHISIKSRGVSLCEVQNHQNVADHQLSDLQYMWICVCLLNHSPQTSDFNQ